MAEPSTGKGLAKEEDVVEQIGEAGAPENLIGAPDVSNHIYGDGYELGTALEES